MRRATGGFRLCAVPQAVSVYAPRATGGFAMLSQMRVPTMARSRCMLTVAGDATRVSAQRRWRAAAGCGGEGLELLTR